MAGTSPWTMMDQAQALPPRTSEQTDEPMVPDYAVDSDVEDLHDVETAKTAHKLMREGVSPVDLMKLAPKSATQQFTNAVTTQTRTPGPASDENAALVKQYGEMSQQSMKDQKTGLGDLQKQIDAYKNEKQGMDYTPFASFAKFLNPQNDFVADAKAMAPQSEEAKAEKLINLTNMLQQRKQDMSKEQLSALAAQIKASKDTSLDSLVKQSVIEKNKSIAGSMTGANRAVMQQTGDDNSLYKQAVREITGNKDAKQKLAVVNGLDNAYSIIDGTGDAGPVPQTFHEYQQAVIGAVQQGRASGSGVSERLEKYLGSAGIDAAKFRQYMTGEPVGIGVENKLMELTKHFAAQERQNATKQRETILNASGAMLPEGWHNRNPDKAAAYKKLVRGFNEMPGADPAHAKSGEADLSKMSNDELKAYLGGG